MIKVACFCLFISVAWAAVANRNVALRSNPTSASYQINQTPLSFLQAWASCENSGKQFLSIASINENSNLAQYLNNLGVSSGYFWIGGLYTQDGLVNRWSWVHAYDFPYKNFVSNTVNLDIDNCILYSHVAGSTSGSWKISNCASKYKYICVS